MNDHQRPISVDFDGTLTATASAASAPSTQSPDALKSIRATICAKFDAAMQAYDKTDEDSYVTRDENRRRYSFLASVVNQLDSSVHREELDLTHRYIGHAWDNDEANEYALNGLDYVPECERERTLHEGHISSIATEIAALKAAGWRVETEFMREEPEDDTWRFYDPDFAP